MNEKPCPSCGYCPTCGRQNFTPTYPTYPWITYPNTWPYLTWSTSGASQTISSGASTTNTKLDYDHNPSGCSH